MTKTARPDLPVDLFDFDLPEDLIALRPAVPRTASRLLVSQHGKITDSQFSRFGEMLRAGDLLVFNDTRVIPARLFGERSRGENVVAMEATLIERVGPSKWRSLAKPGKRLKTGDNLRFGDLGAKIEAKEEGGAVLLSFDLGGHALDVAIAGAGSMPLPPYIAARRPADEQDNTDYQTVLAARDGAVAAPTAALHFDEALLEELAAKGINHTTVTLHVGPGTFLPVKADTTGAHVMHSESGEISAEAADRINVTREAGGRIVSVGTTSLRVLETVADENGRMRSWSGATDIFISPGYRFRATDALLTNFHLPRSTLIMLVSALVGIGHMREIYNHAISQGYRFYSYGDASLLFRENNENFPESPSFLR